MLDGRTWDTSVVSNFESTKLPLKTQTRRVWWNPAPPFGPYVLFFSIFAGCVGWRRNPRKLRVVLWMCALLFYSQGVIMLAYDGNLLSSPNFWKSKPWAFFFSFLFYWYMYWCCESELQGFYKCSQLLFFRNSLLKLLYSMKCFLALLTLWIADKTWKTATKKREDQNQGALWVK